MADSFLVFRKQRDLELAQRNGARVSRSTPLHRIQKVARLRLPKSGSTVRAFAPAYRRPACTAVYMNAVYTTANPMVTANTPMINATIITPPLPVSCSHTYSCSMKGP